MSHISRHSREEKSLPDRVTNTQKEKVEKDNNSDLIYKNSAVPHTL